MYSLHTYVVLFTCSVGIGTSVSIDGIVDNAHSDSPLFIEHYSEKKPVIRSEGIFERFLRNYLHMLTSAFTGKQLVRYCRMIYKELKRMEFTYTERLAKHYRRLSRMHRDDIVFQMGEYRKQYNEKLPKQQDFLQTFNEVFTLQENLRFEDYIHDMLDFANGHKLSLQEETRKLLNDVIVNSVDKMGERDKRVLEKKLSLAIKEYNANY